MKTLALLVPLLWVSITFGQTSPETIYITPDYRAQTYQSLWDIYRVVDGEVRSAGWAERGFSLPEDCTIGDLYLLSRANISLYLCVMGPNRPPKDLRNVWQKLEDKVREIR